MKIAVCFYGLLREVDTLNTAYSDFDSNTFDFFISSGCKDLCSEDINLRFSSSNFEKDKDIKVNTLLFNERVAKACYHINKVIRLKEDFEIKNRFAYDAVVLLRTDRNYPRESIITVCKKVIDVSNSLPPRPVCYVSTQPRVDYNYLSIPNDDLYIYNNEGANLHANLYNTLFLQKNYLKSTWDFNKDTDNGHWVHSYLLGNYPFYTIFTY